MEEHCEEEGATAPSLMFSRSAPIPVKNVLTRVLSEDETVGTSNEPCFLMCSQYQQRMRADILIPSLGFDCRLLIRSCEFVKYDKKAAFIFLIADGKLYRK